MPISLALLRTDRIASRRILRGLKKDCLVENGNKDFWAELQHLGRDMSLISSSEAKRVGGTSDVSDSAAELVSALFWSMSTVH